MWTTPRASELIGDITLRFNLTLADQDRLLKMCAERATRQQDCISSDIVRACWAKLKNKLRK